MSAPRKIFYQLRLSTRPLPEAYQPNPSGRFLWLQKLAQNVLKRWGRHVITEVENVEQIDIREPKSLLDGILDEIEARVGFAALAREELAIVVGEKIHHELLMEMSGDIQFWMNSREGRTCFGIPVFVSSWFEGWIVLPRVAVMRPMK